jgi:ribosome biogenesis GTPase
MVSKRVEGTIVRFTGHEVWVDVGGDVIPTVLRGRFRQKGRGMRVVAGDRVEVDLPVAEGAPGTIEGLLPRKSWLSKVSGARDAEERVIVANIDRIFFVVSAAEPEPGLGFVDRVLVSAEYGRNDVVICLNKIDLPGVGDVVHDFVEMYETIGYTIVQVSAATGDGVNAVSEMFEGGVYAFVGQSGVGKSSLLNRIDPALNLPVRDVAEKTGRGRHTTTYSQLFPIRGGYMADTPGMQTFGFPGLEQEALAACFPEFRELIPNCRFQPCTHSHEPDCAVKAALDDGRIFESRHRNYLGMLEELENRSKGRY